MRGSRGRGSCGRRGHSRGRGTPRGRRSTRVRQGSRGRGFRGHGATSNVPIILNEDVFEHSQCINDRETKIKEKKVEEEINGFDVRKQYLEDLHSWILSGLHCDVDDLGSVAREILALEFGSGKSEKIEVDEEMEKEIGKFTIRIRGYVLSKVVYDSLSNKEFKAFAELLHFLDLKPSERGVETFLLSLIPCLATKLLKQFESFV